MDSDGGNDDFFSLISVSNSFSFRFSLSPAAYERPPEIVPIYILGQRCIRHVSCTDRSVNVTAYDQAYIDRRRHGDSLRRAILRPRDIVG